MSQKLKMSIICLRLVFCFFFKESLIAFSRYIWSKDKSKELHLGIWCSDKGGKRESRSAQWLFPSMLFNKAAQCSTPKKVKQTTQRGDFSSRQAFAYWASERQPSHFKRPQESGPVRIGLQGLKEFQNHWQSSLRDYEKQKNNNGRLRRVRDCQRK